MDNSKNENLISNSSNGTLLNYEQSSHCLPSSTLNAIGVQYVYASDVVVTVFNLSFGVFAFLVNLAVIITIIRTLSLHRPFYVLLCSLASADCLTGLVAQPVHASWRFSLHHVADPCKLVLLHQASKSLPFLLVGCTFVNLAITILERLYAVSKPISYSTCITLKGMFESSLAI